MVPARLRSVQPSLLVSRVSASSTPILAGSSAVLRQEVSRRAQGAYFSSQAGTSGTGDSTSASAGSNSPPLQDLTEGLKAEDLPDGVRIAEEGEVIEGMPSSSGRKVATGIPVDDEHLAKLRAALDAEDKFDERKDNPEGQATPASSQTLKGSAERQEFQAETRKLLDIVAHSLYTDKEVFIRELISNASDALEKLRYRQAVNEASGEDAALEIKIFGDKVSNTLVIQDSGIGMTKEEMIQNLGSIGRSGSLEFLKSLQENTDGDQSAKPITDVIGKFGVGFYSVFMVSKNVRVFSRSALASDGSTSGWCWTSDGSGTYDLQEAENVDVGTKIVIELDGPQNGLFSTRDHIESVIKKYSNFVGFDISVNGEKVNTVRALWTLSKQDISDEDHKEFYQFISHAYDTPRYNLLYSADAPLHIRSLFYIGHSHSEKFGMPRMEPGVSLFSRKVLIQHNAQALLPDWLRFVKGVVDSEDVSLNISREHLQDSALIRKMNSVVTRRILRWLADEAKRDPDGYSTFFRDFGFFLKEGACQDAGYREDLSKLMRFESSQTPEGKTTSFEDYVGRAGDDQQAIYFMVAPNREIAERSPYFEQFKEDGTEVLFLYTPLDDFVMRNLAKFKGKKLVSIEQKDAVPDKPRTSESKDSSETEDKSQTVAPWVPGLLSWMKEALSSKVSAVRHTHRLRDSPAIVVDHESGAFRRMMRHVDPERAASQQLSKQELEINPEHPIIKQLGKIHTTNPALAQLVTDQIFDNALVEAGLLDDARTMVPRVNQILESALSSGEFEKLGPTKTDS